MTYENYMVKAILSANSHNITGVNNVEMIKDLFYHIKLYDRAVSLIKEGDIEAIKALKMGKRTFEDITIIQFTDQNGRPFIACLYDSDELWQDPEVIEIFELS